MGFNFSSEMNLLGIVKKYKFEVLVVFLWVIAIFSRTVFLDNYVGDRDIFFQYLESRRVRSGVNPYERIIGEDIRINDKYPTLFPFSYIFLAGLDFLAGTDFFVFCFLLRWLTLFLELIASFAILTVAKRKGAPLLGTIAVGFWLFSRWSLYNFAQARLDGIALSLAFLAVYFYRKRSNVLPFLVMSFSLAVKHLGVFILPLFVFDSIRESNWQQFLCRVLLLVSVPLAFSLPFYLDSPEGFLLSLGFSVTRMPETSNIGYGWDLVTEEFANFLLPKTGLVGTFPGTLLYYMLPRLPLIIAFFLFMLFSYLEKWDKYNIALVGMLVFLSFNPVIFTQYFAWVVPFILIAGLERVSTG